jgi:hypothetical protein
MNNIPGSLDDIISELSASFKGQSGEAMLRRINTERAIKLALEELVLQRQDFQIRVLTDNRIAGLGGADVLIQVDDYEIRLVLLDAATEKLEIDMEIIQQFRNIFEENPSTELMVLTWTTDDLKSQRISLTIIDYLSEYPEKIQLFLDKAKHLLEVMDEILTSHMKLWDSVPISPSSAPSSISNVKKLFLKHMETTIREERQRSFRTPEKKIASHQILQEREISVLTGALDEALQGTMSNHLVIRLAQLPKRGAR